MSDVKVLGRDWFKAYFALDPSERDWTKIFQRVRNLPTSVDQQGELFRTEQIPNAIIARRASLPGTLLRRLQDNLPASRGRQRSRLGSSRSRSQTPSHRAFSSNPPDRDRRSRSHSTPRAMDRGRSRSQDRARTADRGWSRSPGAPGSRGRSASAQHYGSGGSAAADLLRTCNAAKACFKYLIGQCVSPCPHGRKHLTARELGIPDRAVREARDRRRTHPPASRHNHGRAPHSGSGGRHRGPRS